MRMIKLGSNWKIEFYDQIMKGSNLKTYFDNQWPHNWTIKIKSSFNLRGTLITWDKEWPRRII